MSRVSPILGLVVVVVSGWMGAPSAWAQMPPPLPHRPPDPDPVVEPPSQAPQAPPESAPAPQPSTPSAPHPRAPAVVAEPEEPEDAETTDVPMVEAAAQAASAARYGVGFRTRWASVPKWLLGLFLDESVPLSSYTIGVEGFRRTGNFELVLGLSWQSLSPPDGNWLGKGNAPSTDTDFVQFKGMGAFSADVAFILHTEFSDHVGLHYGGGIGLGIVTGRLLRTSAGSERCADNPGSVTECHPVVCPQGPCTDSQLGSTEGGTDGPASPSRFQESHVPPVYPIVDLVTGLDFRLPARPDLAFKIDVGYFFPYFFVGGGISYRL